MASRFGESERNRRWSLIRQGMRERGLSCLVVSGMGWGNQNLVDIFEWVSNDTDLDFVIFPLDGEPMTLLNLEVKKHIAERKSESWVKDVRVSPNPAQEILEKIRQGGAGSKVGVVGLERMSLDTGGNIPYRIWSEVSSGAQNASFEDATGWLVDLALPKSEEELMLVKKAADAAERACMAFLGAAKVGVTEDELYRVSMNAVLGERAQMPLYVISSGRSFVGRKKAEWLGRSPEPRALKAGEMVSAEMGVKVFGYQAQVQMCVAFKPVDPLHVKAAEVATEVSQVAIREMKAGARWGDVCSKLEEPFKKAGAWSLLPMAHSMNPQMIGTQSGINYAGSGPGFPIVTRPTQTPELVLQKNMVFEVEPAVCVGDRGVILGGTVVVKDSGAQPLNHLAFELQQV